MDDPYDLRRFVEARDPVYDRVLAELRQGRKASHWMWFVFPQIAGLGHSPMAQKFAVRSVAEAQAYLRHPVLVTRLRACAALVLHTEGRSAFDIFGTPDDMKFRSSMTLFAQASPATPVFAAALQKFYAGEPDPATLARL